VTPLRQWAAAAVAAPFVVGVLAVGVFVVWAAKDAGYAATTWYPGALFLLVLAVVAALAYGRLAPSRPALVALGFFAAFAAWGELSILWASDRGIAWEGANRTLLYVVVYALFAGLPWRRESVPILLCGFSFAVLAIGLVDLARASGGDANRFFTHGRLSAPAGYPNGACAIFILAFWPLVYLAARREPPAVVRGVLLAAATVLVELALMTQSRGSLVAVPVAVVAYVVLVPARLRATCALLVVGLTVFLARDDLLDVFEPVRSGEGAGGAIDAALQTIGLSAAAIFVVWTLFALADRRIELQPRVVRLANIGALALIAAALVVGAVTVAASKPGPGERIGDAWRHFKAGYPENPTGSHFSLGLGSNRYDFWRVAAGEFRDHPILGVGMDNFAEDYMRERRSTEEPLYPHSLELRVLGQTGIVGAILFAGFVLAAGVGVARTAGWRTDLVSGTARAGVAAAAYLAIHGSGDWFWEFPGLTAPALAWLGLAAAPAPLVGESAVRRRRALLAVGSLVAIAVAASMLFPWLAEKSAQRAARTWAREPAQAFADLNRSRDLNPLSARADLLAGAIASRLDDLPRMRLAFKRALARDSHSWYAHFELGLAEAALGRRNEALEQLRVAARLNPREELIEQIRRRVAQGRRIDRDEVDRLFVARLRSRIGP
jgi:hypothetical protein